MNEVDIKQFAYEEAFDGEGDSYDQNRVKRFQLIIAIQYDRDEHDEALLEELFKQEIRMHEEAPFQGLYPSISLCAHLLAQFRNPSHVWLFTNAKLANFDTFLGFDYQYVVPLGLRKHIDMWRIQHMS